MNMRVSAYAKDHFGHKRTTTEDVYRVYEDLGLYIVCDGSRDRDGRWAAETVCDAIHQTILAQKQLLSEYKKAPSRAKRLEIQTLAQKAVQQACAVIYQSVVVDQVRGFSTTAVDLLIVLEDCAVSAHVGNTRFYLIRNSKALKITQDHTYYEEMLAGNPTGKGINPSFKKRLTRAIGDSESVPVATTAVSLMPRDLLLLCSNGFSDHLDAEGRDLVGLCTGKDAANLAQIAARLVDHALSHGSDDNIAIALVQVETDAVNAPAVAPSRDARRQLDLLRSIEAFSGIKDDEAALLKLQGLLTFRTAQPGAVIVEQGSPSDEMFVLLSGSVDVKVAGKSVALRKTHDVIGEMGFFTRELRSATVVARDATELMAIQRWEFDALVESEWKLGFRILEGIVQELAHKLKG
jgi:serine/threonine protein phosphatase PrpC